MQFHVAILTFAVGNKSPNILVMMSFMMVIVSVLQVEQPTTSIRVKGLCTLGEIFIKQGKVITKAFKIPLSFTFILTKKQEVPKIFSLALQIKTPFWQLSKNSCCCNEP